MKTNAARILDQHAFSYRTIEYEVGDENFTAVDVAHKVGMPAEQVFKTLVVRGDRTGAMLAVVPGPAELSLKHLAALSGDKSVEMVALKEVQPLTGYVRGGVSPLGTRKKYPVFIDEFILAWDEVSVSAGLRGAQLIVKPSDLIAATGAVVGNISG